MRDHPFQALWVFWSQNDHLAIWLLRRASSKLRARASNMTRRASTLLLLLDLTLAVLAMAIGFTLRYGNAFGPPEMAMLTYAAPIFALVCTVVFTASGLYTTHWRYPSLGDMLRIPRAVLAASTIFLGVVFFVNRLEGFSRLAIIISAFILVAMLAAVRLAFRADELAPRGGRAGDATRSERRPRVPALLVGSNSAADQFIRALHRDPHSTLYPVGLLDNDRARSGMTVRGVRIMGALNDAEAVLARLAADGESPGHVIFTDPLTSFDEGEVSSLIELAGRIDLEVSRLPQSIELRDPRKHGRYDLRPIELSDLLARPQTAFDVTLVRRVVSGRRILVTGAGGSIGSELCKQLAALTPSEMLLADNCEFNLYRVDLELREAFPDLNATVVICDVRDALRVDDLFSRFEPELVFHAAALKHVPIVELNPAEGVLTNVVGSRNVADAARRVGARAMVQISTDKAVNTTNVMGATKRVAELYCQALDIHRQDEGRTGSRFMTVRFGNVLGSSGSLIPLFQRQIARGGPLTITHPEIRRFFMTIREAVELTLQASAHGLEAHGGHGEIFVLDMGEPIRIVDIARRMIQLAGLTPDKDVQIKIVGLRPGEKLHEELFDASERLADAQVSGVFRAIPRPLPLDQLTRDIGALERAAHARDSERMFDLLRTLVTGYEPSMATLRTTEWGTRPVPSRLPRVLAIQAVAT